MAQQKVLLPMEPPRETDSSEEELARIRGAAPRRGVAAGLAVAAAAAVGVAVLVYGQSGSAAEGPAQVASAPAAIELTAAGGPDLVTDWKALLAKDSYSDGGEKVGALHTDGHAVDFEVDLDLGGPDAFARTRTILASEPGNGLTLQAMKTASPGTGTLRLLGSTLSGTGHGGCLVESALVSVGKLVKVQVMRDEERCCLGVQQAGGEQEVRCSERDEGTKDFQMRPGDHIVVPKDLPRKLISVKKETYQENVGTMTVSFKVTHIKYDELTEKCKCLEDVIQSVKEAVTFWGAGAKSGQVYVSVKRSADFGKKSLPQLTAKQVNDLHAKFTNGLVIEENDAVSEEEEWQDRMKKFTIDTIDTIEEGDKEDEKDECEPSAGEKPMRLSAWKAFTWSLKSPSGYVKALTDAAKEADPTFDGEGTDAIEVLLTMQCGRHCDEDKVALSSEDFKDIVLGRLTSVVNRPLRGATTGHLEMKELSSPAGVTTCAHMTCNEFRENTHPLRACVGSLGCQKQCCEPWTCKHVTCGSGLKKVKGWALKKKCEDGHDCREKCCLKSCASVKCCGDSVCPKPNKLVLFSKPSEVHQTCCYEKFPKCCTAHTPWCAACHKCTSVHHYCKAHKLLLPFLGRRLRAEGSKDDKKVEDVETEAPAVLEAPPAMRRLLDEEFQAHLREAHESLNATLASKMELAGRRLAEEDASVDEKRADKQAELMAEALKKLTDSAMKGGKQFTDMTPVKGELPHTKWNAAVAAAAKKYNYLASCAMGAGSLPCEYYLEAIFDHNIVSHGHVSANTVTILTDTYQAVSCDSGGFCWVWKLATGVPHTVWVPDELCDLSPRAPVFSVTALYDATYILSVGQKDATNISKGGVGYLWDWRRAFQIRKFSCDDGIYLSSSQIPLWRMLILGCSDGTTQVSNWGTGNEYDLPYNAKTAEEIRDEFQGILANYLENSVDGIVRLAIVRKGETIAQWIQRCQEEHPVFAAVIQKVADVKDWAYDYKYRNNMGAVTSIAYLPTYFRFVTGSDDGNMRCWDAASGTLLRVMKHGYSGRVNAVAGFPHSLMAASGGDDGIVKVWDVETGLMIRYFDQRYGGPIVAIQVFPGGKNVAVASADGFVRVWDFKDGTLCCAFWTGVTASHSITSMAVNPSNPLGQIVVAASDGKVRVFNPLHGKLPCH